MKDGLVISASWAFLEDSMLATLPILEIEDPRTLHKQVWEIYRREMTKLPIL